MCIHVYVFVHLCIISLGQRGIHKIQNSSRTEPVSFSLNDYVSCLSCKMAIFVPALMRIMWLSFGCFSFIYL